MTPCITWNGALDSDGYARRHRGLAHRIAFEEVFGPIPQGLVIDHLCRNRACINPDHMEAVTRRENTLRGLGPCAINHKKSACILGHAFDDANTYYAHARNRQGVFKPRRICRACNAQAVKAYKAKKKAIQA